MKHFLGLGLSLALMFAFTVPATGVTQGGSDEPCAGCIVVLG